MPSPTTTISRQPARSANVLSLKVTSPLMPPATAASRRQTRRIVGAPWPDGKKAAAPATVSGTADPATVSDSPVACSAQRAPAATARSASDAVPSPSASTMRSAENVGISARSRT